ncbi:uncharacterized protein LOC122849330 [Aphidius gifuensis]|uniref:uncharacterized protein LOC122849330 n=1 Tax=Aphidius gifuensis TaxID=684658 RepID=UPI001CDC8E35|nr:uncharacterized protein LOC122849330 [Aphidius gifuensis]
MMNRAKRRRIEKDHQVSADDVEEKMDFINSLNNDSLARIFMMLPISERITMNQVCSKWKEACQLAWHDIKKYKCTNTIVRNHEKCILTQSYVEKILVNCGIYLKELILSKVCDSSIMPIIAKHCKNLTTLEFVIYIYKEERYTDRFRKAFKQLKQLKAIKIHIYGYNFKFQMLNSLPKDINEIHLFFIPYVSQESLGLDPKECSLVISSYLFYSVKVSRFSLKKFTNLQKLTMHSCTINNIIQEISQKTTLVYLDLQECKTTKKIFTFNQLSNLEHLNIKGVSFEDSPWQNIPNPISGIFNTCKKLKHLKAPDFDVDLAEIKMENWANLQNLAYLNIRWQASDAIIKNIIKYCNNLEFINIDDKEVMVAILDNCKKLKHLVIHENDRVETSIFNDLSKVQYIENLNLAHSGKLKNSAIIAIAKNCKLLKCLNIQNCSITPTGYIALTSLENLKELNIESNKNVKEDFIVKLRGIKSLNCSKCKKLTDAGVIQFIKNNPDLEFLDISDIPKVTIDTIIAAEEVSKNRTNDTFLSIKTYDHYLSRACIESQWLV